MTYVNKFYKLNYLLLLQLVLILISNSSCTLNASISSLESLSDLTKPIDVPSSEIKTLDFELQVAVETLLGKLLNSPEVILYDGDVVTLHSLKLVEGTLQGVSSSVEWSFTTDTSASLVVASDKQSAQLTLNGVGSLTITVTLDGKMKDYSLSVNARPSLIATSVKTTSNATFSYTDVDVDWNRELAFTASRKSNTCSDVVSFGNNTPTLVRSIGSASLQVCLGVKLFDNNSKIILSSSTSAKVAAWDISPGIASPSSWYSMGEYSTGAASKRVTQLTQISPTSWEMISTRRYGVYKAAINLSGVVNSYTAGFSLLSSYIETSEFNSSVVLGDKVLAQSFTTATETIREINSSFTQLNRVKNFFIHFVLMEEWMFTILLISVTLFSSSKDS